MIWQGQRGLLQPRKPWWADRNQRWRWRHWRLWWGRSFDPADPLQVYTFAVMGLGRTTREVFLLHRIEGMAFGAISDQLGLGVEIVQTRMSAAMYHISFVVDAVGPARDK